MAAEAQLSEVDFWAISWAEWLRWWKGYNKRLERDWLRTRGVIAALVGGNPQEIMPTSFDHVEEDDKEKHKEAIRILNAKS
jgi:hypothetical protein